MHTDLSIFLETMFDNLKIFLQKSFFRFYKFNAYVFGMDLILYINYSTCNQFYFYKNLIKIFKLQEYTCNVLTMNYKSFIRI